MPARDGVNRIALWAVWAGLAAGCSGSAAGSGRGGGGPREDDLGPLDLEIVRAASEKHRQYVEALLLCGSSAPADWDRARRALEILQPYHVFREDPELIRAFRAGDERARLELGRRGRILQALSVLWGRYDKDAWDEARRTLLDEGEPGQVLLATTLLQRLLSEQFRVEEVPDARNPALRQVRDVSVHLRYQIVESGPVALETAVALADALAKDTPATPLFRHEDLTQVLLVLIQFGDRGRPKVEELAGHPNPNVRRVVARALGEGRDPAGLSLLARMLAGDAEWAVRAGAAQGLGRMAPARAAAGRILVERLREERDRTVRLAILEALGELRYEEAIPDLMAMLDVPSVEVSTAAMAALYRITGEKFVRREDWSRWYAEQYPRWKSRRPK
ncbi:MAG TPA: HEAT repeat domain-containing protein [Planctomycetota bacterium]|nr:HEAT repeat domain-containing protein [Planctomycetota bacterium]